MNKKIIFSIIAIIIILAIFYFSQKPWLWGNEKTFIHSAIDQGKAYAQEGSNWVMSKIYPKISEEAQKRGEMIKNEVNQEKQKVSENIGEKISDYFSGVADSVLHPGTPQNCPDIK